ncbi:MAG: hypothetical protein QM750_11925 [Rubrivivax sp.]
MSTDKKHVRCLKTDDLDLWHRVAATMNALHHTAGVVVLSRLMNFGPGEPALIVQLNGQCPYWTRCDDETAEQFRRRAAAEALQRPRLPVRFGHVRLLAELPVAPEDARERLARQGKAAEVQP